jgi:hypothetical protein
MDSTTSDTPAKTPGKDKEKNQDRINRKRVQNRISQQCVREKQLAHAKRLEALAEVIKTSTEADATSAATQSNLLNNQLALIEENRDLRDELLRMRKKMLSLSSAVAAAAGKYSHFFLRPASCVQVNYALAATNLFSSIFAFLKGKMSCRCVALSKTPLSHDRTSLTNHQMTQSLSKFSRSPRKGDKRV